MRNECSKVKMKALLIEKVIEKLNNTATENKKYMIFKILRNNTAKRSQFEAQYLKYNSKRPMEPKPKG